MIQRACLIVLLTALAALSWPAGGTAARPAPESPSVAPAAPAAMVNVAIQAGHWKSNELPDEFRRLRGSTGASGGGRTESQVTVDIAQRVARLLRSRGLTVEVLPATVPTGYTADLFISLHADGTAQRAAARLQGIDSLALGGGGIGRRAGAGDRGWVWPGDRDAARPEHHASDARLLCL
jgi:hypothetical protein